MKGTENRREETVLKRKSAYKNVHTQSKAKWLENLLVGSNTTESYTEAAMLSILSLKFENGISRTLHQDKIYVKNS